MKRKRDEFDQDDGIYVISSSQEPNGSPREDTSLALSDSLSDDSDYNSLFDAEDDSRVAWQINIDNNDSVLEEQPARRLAPLIPGLYFDPSVLIPTDIAEELWTDCMETYFKDKNVNQIMLFERARATKVTVPDVSGGLIANENDVVPTGMPRRCLPLFLLDLLDALEKLLKDVIPPAVHTLLFPPDDESGQARQVILNHYRPGEGITPHIDLLKRYGDGIIGVSLHSGTVMHFAKISNSLDELMNAVPGLASGNDTDGDTCSNRVPTRDPLEYCPKSYGAYLPERSVIVLSGEARYRWTHGINQCTEDMVESVDGISPEILPRSERLSITFRWLLPGADVVGG